jgi:hypothetical protein
MGGVNYGFIEFKIGSSSCSKCGGILFKSTSNPIQRNDFGFDLINEL